MRLRAVREDEAARLREIRLACLADDPEAFTSTHADEEARPDGWWTRWATRSAAGDEQTTFVVTDDDDGWHGLALVRADDEHPGEAVINSMWVASEARGNGCGRALCDACVTWAIKRDFAAVNLCVMLGNDAALRLYQTAGFVEKGRTSHIVSMTRVLR